MTRSTLVTSAVVAGFAAFAGAIAALTPALALVPSLSPSDVRAAVAAGKSAAARHVGLVVEQYVAYAVPDSLVAQPGGKAIDAIVVGTPYERVMYASYESAFQNASLAPAALDAAASADCIDVIVVAHSRDGLDQSFLRRFRNPTLRIGGHPMRPSKTTTLGPSKDFFTTTNGRELLWLGNDAFRFDLHGLEAAGIAVTKAQGRFSIVDPYGHTYDVKLDLAKYR